jgi:hypothetical protein
VLLALYLGLQPELVFEQLVLGLLQLPPWQLPLACALFIPPKSNLNNPNMFLLKQKSIKI